MDHLGGLRENEPRRTDVAPRCPSCTQPFGARAGHHVICEAQVLRESAEVAVQIAQSVRERTRQLRAARHQLLCAFDAVRART
jgi:hypothetical protein